MVNYLKAFKRPFSGDKYIFLKAAIPIYNFAVFGYIIECIRNTLQGKDELPDWKNTGWFYKVFSPIGASLVTLVFFGLPFMLPLGFILVNLAKFSGVISWIFLTLAVILTFVGCYYPIGAFVSYIKNWNLKDIGYKRISKIVFTWKYFFAWLITLIISWIISFMFTNIYLLWFGMIVILVLCLPAWTIIAEAIREIEKEKKL